MGSRWVSTVSFIFSPLFCLTHAFLFYPEKHFLLMIEFTIAKV